jgi:hypothetical protein
MPDFPQQISDVQRRYEANVRTIQNEIDRKEEYKAREIQRVYDDATQKAQEIFQNEKDRLEVELKAARHTAFQPVLKGADPAALWDSYRSCLAEAKRITTANDLQAAMEEAEMIGDAVKAKALLYRAYELQDGKSVGTYLHNHPEEKPVWDQLVKASEDVNEFEKQAMFNRLSRFKRPEEWDTHLQAKA